MFTTLRKQKNPRICFLLAEIILITLIVVPTQSAVTWSTYPDIKTSQIIVYNGPQLVNSNWPAATFAIPISFSPATTPFNVAFGINLFQVPNDQDFSIITNKTFTSSMINLRVYLQDDTVCLKLYFNYIAMVNTSQIFRLLTDSLNPTIISDNYGYRSETDIMTVNTTGDPFFTSQTLSSILVLEGIRVVPTGEFSFVDTMVSLDKNGVINTTFITFESTTITYIAYSIIFCDQTQADLTTKLIFRSGNIQLTNNSSIANSFFNSIDNDARYTGAAGRMFFGISSFNFSVTQTKNFGFDSSIVGNLYSTYTFSNSISQIKLSYFFFAQRTCPSGDYFYNDWISPNLDDCVSSCSGFVDRPNNDPVYSQCLACHTTCLTCSSTLPSSCLTCDSSKFRVIAGATPTSCNCMANYVNIANNCVLCSTQITGCLSCSSSTTCTSCLPDFSGPPCVCANGSIVNGYCNTVKGCTNISMINGTQVCINCNASLLYELSSSFICTCVFGTLTLPNQSCQSICGDSYVLRAQACDDGNSNNGDGCSSNCLIQQDWTCAGKLAQGSKCRIHVVVELSYLGALRDTSSNSATFYFKLSPDYAQYQKIDYTGLLKTNLSYHSMKVQYNAEHKILSADIEYLKDIEHEQYQFQLLLNKSLYFIYPTNLVWPTLNGINCQLTFDTNFTQHQAFYYTLMVLLFASLLVFIISCLFFQKWIGLELVLTYQTYYFLFALAKRYPYQLSAFPEVLKYSQGFDGILNGQYYRTYTLSSHLLTLSIQKEFISNFNTMMLLILTLILVLIFLGLRRRKYKLMLEEVISSDLNRKVKKAQKMFSFVFSRIFVMAVLFSMFKIIFSFCVQLSNQQSLLEHFPDELNVAAGILAFVILFSIISYILYWYILLPDNFTQEQQFMSLSFQKMKFNYPIIYLGYQVLFILTLSILTPQVYIVYIILSLQIIYLVFLVFYQPYNTIHRFNRLLHNATVIFNQFSGMVCLGIIMRWNSIIGTPYQVLSNSQLKIYCIFMMVMLFISLALAVFRLVVFNKEVSFECCKKQELQKYQEIDYETMRKIENERQLQKRNGEQNVQMTIFSAIQPQISPYQEEDRRNKKTNEPLENLNQAQIDAYLNQKAVHWNRQAMLPKNGPQVSHRNIKKTSSSKKSTLQKSSLQIYLESKKKRQGQNN